MHLSPVELASRLDHTLLKADANEAAVTQLCTEARELGCASVCVLPWYVHQANELLDQSAVAVCTVVGFPLGATYGMVKAHEAREAIARGATEIDMVMNIAALKNRQYDDVLYDIEEVVEPAHALGAIVKVIIETSLLSVDEKIRACELVTHSGADFIKTSTGFSSAGATVDDVVLMRQHSAFNVRIKASGGIRSCEFALQLIEAGADRLGTSASVAILSELGAQKSA